MIYLIRRKADLPREFRRIALEQLDAAIGQLRSDDIHQARRGLKHARALLDLVGSDDATAELHSTRLRDAARKIGEARDMEVCIALVGTLAKTPGTVAPELFLQAQTALSTLIPPPDAIRTATQSALQSLQASRKALADWTPAVTDRTVRKALKHSYRASRDALQTAQTAHAAPAASKDHPTDVDPEHLHNLRKQIKRLGSQLRLVRSYRPRLIKELVREAARLGSLLGDEHDLAVLQQKLNQAGVLKTLPELADLVAIRRIETGKKALVQATRFLKHKPSLFVRRQMKL